MISALHFSLIWSANSRLKGISSIMNPLSLNVSWSTIGEMAAMHRLPSTRKTPASRISGSRFLFRNEIWSRLLRADQAHRRIVMGQDDPARGVEYLDVGVGIKEILEFQGHGQLVQVAGVLGDLLQFRQEKRLAHQVAQVFQEDAFGHFLGFGDLLLGRFLVALGDGDDRKIQGDEYGQDGDDDQGKEELGLDLHFICRSKRKSLPRGSGRMLPSLRLKMMTRLSWYRGMTRPSSTRVRSMPR